MELAVDAVRLSPRCSIRAAAKSFSVPKTTLLRKVADESSTVDKVNDKRALTTAEEDAIVKYVLDLDSRGFSPRRAYVQDMADLLVARDASGSTGPTASLHDDQSSARVFLAPTTTGGPCKKIPT
jgi:helix-turn-helix, Psq domain